MNRKVAGILRVKNDGMFIEKCVESCIDALDELIIIYNDCTDNSAEEIGKMAAKYPNKIKSCEYPHRIYGMYITKDEFEIAKGLPEGHPSLLSTYCNFALSMVTADYALKIDADQVYFTNQLKSLCNFLRECEPKKKTVKTLAGQLFSMYLSVYRWLSLKSGKFLPLLPARLVQAFYPAYIDYSKYLFSRNEACLALSGINVLEMNETLISMGHAMNGFKASHPFNGCGDTLVFKVGTSARFEKLIMPEYNPPYTKQYSVFEVFRAPCEKVMFVGFFWKHLNVMRVSTIQQALNLHHLDKNAYLPISKFEKMGYTEIMNQSADNVCPLFQRIIFDFIYKANKRSLIENLRKAVVKK